MELSFNSATHPIIQLRDDVINFLEAIEPQPGSEMNKTGYKFVSLLKELHQLYEMEYTLEHIESCFHCPDFINHADKK